MLVILKRKAYFLFIYVYAHMSVGDCKFPETVAGPLNLDLQKVVNKLSWVLETQLSFSARVAGSLHC